MSGERMETDPNLIQVLEDIAADPRSRLFKMSARKWLAAVRGEGLHKSQRTVRLAPAERELLRVYRAEMGYLLRCKVIHEVRNSDASRNGLCYIDFELPSEPEWQARVDSLLGLPVPRGTEFRDGLRTDSGLSQGQRIQRAIVSALEFEEHASPYGYVTYAYLLSGGERQARSYLKRKLIDASVPLELHLMEQLAQVEAETGHPVESLDILSRAAARHRWPGFGANGVLLSTTLQDLDSLLKFDEILSTTDSSAAISGVCARVRDVASESPWTPKTLRFVEGVLSQVSPSARSILRAFSHS